jgi:ATP-dependent Clp protease ATP-binding subunit ClpC
VAETTAAETLEILRLLQPHYEMHHNVTYTDAAIEACVSLSDRFVSSRAFPDKALDAMDEAGARVHLSGGEVTEETVAEVISMMTGIPASRVGQKERARLLSLEGTLSSQVIGQDEAIHRVVRAIQCSRVGLKDPKKPIGTFLFVGPTGVGKTYLCKCLAKEMFGSEDALIRIDMSEYMEKHTVSRMVGAPPGYVGYDEGGQLTERVRRHPYSIVLLDEIEKAHPDVYNLLLQVMDEGRLTDGNGATIDFKNTVIIMTSNVGTRQLKDFGGAIGFASSKSKDMDKERAREIVNKAIKKQFAPEFINRLDDIVFFDQLDEEAIGRIVSLELQPLMRRIADLGYQLTVTPEAQQLLARKGYDVQYGARPLSRAIRTCLEEPLCEVMMSGGRKRKYKTSVDNDKIILQ